MKARVNTTVQLLRHFGPGWLLFRLGYAFRRRSGVLRRTLPASSWDAQPLASFLRDPSLGNVDSYAESRSDASARFLFSADDAAAFRPYFAGWDAVSEGPTSVADALGEGVFRFFEYHNINLGCPPDWHLNPINGDRYPQDRHWTEIGDFGAGDIKLVWESNRFGWAYPLVRAYWRTGDERYPRLFWRLFDDWRLSNPPQQGVNWKCGQEIAIRLMACCFGLYGFAASPASTPQRIANLAQLMAVSATRIETNLAYALSQQNNHGITEAAGLWTVGVLFPEFKASSRWRRLGRQAIEQQTRSLVDDDGAFSQHSVNYQRVMLDACQWAIQLGQRNDQVLSKECVDRVSRAGEFLWQLQDDATGQLPRYGQNDGALLLPLTNCEHADYRPAVQLNGLQSGIQRIPPGPWDEASLWMLGVDAIETSARVEKRAPQDVGKSQRQKDWNGSAGGYQVLRAKTGHLFTRTPRYCYRPAHADALHVDLWWRGVNVAMDAGTYSYNAAPPWSNPLAGTACHNTVMVDACDQMDRAGRFLWLPWLSGERTAYDTSADGEFAYWEGTHDGYQRLPSPVRHRRGLLRIGAEHWLVIDSLSGRDDHTYRLHWLLPDVPFLVDEGLGGVLLTTASGKYKVAVGSTDVSGEFSLARADDNTPRGWYAPHYADRQPALSVALEVQASCTMFATLLGPAPGAVCLDHSHIEVMANDRPYVVHLTTDANATGPLARRIEQRGDPSGIGSFTPSATAKRRVTSY